MQQCTKRWNVIVKVEGGPLFTLLYLALIAVPDRSADVRVYHRKQCQAPAAELNGVSFPYGIDGLHRYFNRKSLFVISTPPALSR